MLFFFENAVVIILCFLGHSGNLAPGTMLAPGKDAQVSPQGGATRPGGVHGYEQYPPTPPGIALVKPIPQQASPIRVCTHTWNGFQQS